MGGAAVYYLGAPPELPPQGGSRGSGYAGVPSFPNKLGRTHPPCGEWPLLSLAQKKKRLKGAFFLVISQHVGLSPDAHHPCQ